MAALNTTTRAHNVSRSRKGTTSRQRERLKALVLVVIPIAVLLAALARGGVEPRHGEIPDWNASDTTAEAH